jgi:hypothetical protein
MDHSSCIIEGEGKEKRKEGRKGCCGWEVGGKKQQKMSIIFVSATCGATITVHSQASCFRS